MCDLVDKEPTCFKGVDYNRGWIESLMEEYQSIMKNDAWEAVPKPEGKSVVSSKWIYKIEHIVDGIIEKKKYIFVVRGLSQKEGIDNEDTFAHVSR